MPVVADIFCGCFLTLVAQVPQVLTRFRISAEPVNEVRIASSIWTQFFVSCLGAFRTTIRSPQSPR